MAQVVKFKEYEPVELFQVNSHIWLCMKSVGGTSYYISLERGQYVIYSEGIYKDKRCISSGHLTLKSATTYLQMEVYKK